MELNVLTIGGSDPSSGSGIQGDVRTISAMGCHPLTAVTAITAQNTSEFASAVPVNPDVISAQIHAILVDFEVNAVKVGMLLCSDAIYAVSRILKGAGAPVIVDPVIRSTTGGTLLEKQALGDYRKMIIPIAHAITPNVSELSILADMRIEGRGDIEAAARKVARMGTRNIIITGFEENGMIYDHYLMGGIFSHTSHKKITGQSRGGGCAHSAALASMIARGFLLSESIRTAGEFARSAIYDAVPAGRGLSVSLPGSRLYSAISHIRIIPDMWKYIPECQTNFVFAPEGATGINEILGLDGRMVRAGASVIIAGSIIPGGSQHVASALYEIMQVYSDVRSAINIRYDKETISYMKKEGFGIASYDRAAEPIETGSREGASIRWGVREALKGAHGCPDAIYHTGAAGKEPMIIIFGRDPDDIVEKIHTITLK